MIREISLPVNTNLREPLRNRSLPTAGDNVTSCKMFLTFFISLAENNVVECAYYDFVLFISKFCNKAHTRLGVRKIMYYTAKDKKLYPFN